jgi:hypothetical protein
MTVYRFVFLSAVTLGLLSTLQPRSSYAQQFVVDDAAIADYRACQLEAWHGRLSCRILPACSFSPRFELTAGIGFLDDHGNGRETEYVVEAKYVFREMQPNGVGFDYGPGAVRACPPLPGTSPQTGDGDLLLEQTSTGSGQCAPYHINRRHQRSIDLLFHRHCLPGSLT